MILQARVGALAALFVATAATADEPSPTVAPTASGPGVHAAPGLVRTVSALPAAEKLSLLGAGDGFLASDFIYGGSSTTAFGGHLGVAFAPVEAFDLFATIGGGLASNTAAVPATLTTGTEAAVGARVRAKAGPAHFGAAAQVLWSAPLAGPASAGTGLGVRALALASFDLKSAANVPLTVHLNAGYRSDAGATVSRAHFGAWPTYAEKLWRWDVVEVSAAVELPLGAVAPFLEYHLELPIGAGSPAGFATSRVTPGLAVRLPAGLRLLAAADVGVPEGLRDGVPATPPWQAHLALSWSAMGSTPWSLAPPAPVKAPVTPVAAIAPPPEVDPDHDGVMGAQDLCPNEPEDFDGFEDTDGCPDPDNDKDGVPDVKDECPNKAGPAATKGCPDSDGDGVPDNLDACPKVAGRSDNGGCPTYSQVKVTQERLEILQKIYFAFGKDTILPRSFPLLDEVVQVLRDRERLCLRIEGHTDSVGNSDANRKLSKERAEQVRRYLVEHGVGAAALKSEGYGPDLPLDNNATTEGREKNRRVEFVITPCQ